MQAIKLILALMILFQIDTSFAKEKPACGIGRGVYSRRENSSKMYKHRLNYSKENWIELTKKGYGKKGINSTVATLNNFEIIPIYTHSMGIFLRYPIYISGKKFSFVLDQQQCLPNGDCFADNSLSTHLSVNSRVRDAFVELLPTCEELFFNKIES